MPAKIVLLFLDRYIYRRYGLMSSNYFIWMTIYNILHFILLTPMRNLLLESVLGQYSFIVIPARHIDIIMRDDSSWQDIIAAF
jgi:hypothetical protein